MSDQNAPRRGVFRVAFTPAGDPEGTVIAPGLSPDAHHSGTALTGTRLDAVGGEWRAVVARSLPEPVRSAIDDAEAGSLHVWTWADPNQLPQHNHQREPYMAYWLPRVRLREAALADGALLLELSAGPVFSLPYLDRLPADEHPLAIGWDESDRTMAWTTTTVPEPTTRTLPATTTV